MQHTPEQHQLAVNGTRLCYFEWRPEHKDDQPTILLVHATGFHARCWDQVVRQLEDHHVIAVDMRGHGRSGKDGPISWDQFGSDLTALVAHLQLRSAIGVGHSMGGHSLVQAAARVPQAFRRLLLIDPVIMAPEVYTAAAFEGLDEHPTARRRNSWASWEEMFERFRSRLPFSAWEPEVLRDYCRFGLVPTDDGSTLQLACPPRIEAAIYMGSSARDIFDEVRSVQVPVTVLRARQRDPEQERDPMDFSASPTWPGLAGEFVDGRDVHLQEVSHFVPMEQPGLIAEFILGRR